MNPKSVTRFVMVFLYVALNTAIFFPLYKGYHYNIFMRDHGIAAEATVVRTYRTGTKHPLYMLEWQFSPPVSELIPQKSLITDNESVDFAVYLRARPGQKIPIHYDPGNPNHSALSINAPPSNLELLLMAAGIGFSALVGTGCIFLVAYLLILPALGRLYAGQPGGQET